MLGCKKSHCLVRKKNVIYLITISKPTPSYSRRHASLIYSMGSLCIYNMLGNSRFINLMNLLDESIVQLFN